MTRGNPGDLQPFDPELDRTFHILVRHSVHPDHSVHPYHSVHPNHSVHSEHSVAGLNILILSIRLLIFILRTWLNLHLVRGLLGR